MSDASTEVTLAVICAVFRFMTKLAAFPTFHSIALPDLVVRGLADEAVVRLSRVDDATIVGTHGD